MGNYLVLGGYDSGIGEACMKYIDKNDHSAIGTDRSLNMRHPNLVYSAMETIVNSVYDSGEWIDGIVYCPGVNHLEWFGQWGVSGITRAREIMEINTLGFMTVVDAFVMARTLITDNLRQEGEVARMPGKTSIVAISSDAATRPLRTSAPYCASKAALNMMVQVAARELGGSDIRVNAVSPGMVSGTNMSRQMDEDIPEVRGWTQERMWAYEQAQEVVPGRVHVDEVAQVVFDVLTGPPHLNGAIIPVNGGR